MKPARKLHRSGALIGAFACCWWAATVVCVAAVPARLPRESRRLAGSWTEPSYVLPGVSDDKASEFGLKSYHRNLLRVRFDDNPVNNNPSLAGIYANFMSGVAQGEARTLRYNHTVSHAAVFLT